MAERDMAEEKISNLLSAVGVLAETARITYDAFRKQKFTEDQSIELTKGILDTMLKSNMH